MWHDWLTIWGFDVDQAENGAEAVEKATACRPDLVLMDWTMPVLDGLAATERLKSQAGTAGVPVLALSATRFRRRRRRRSAPGARAFSGSRSVPSASSTRFDALSEPSDAERPPPLK